VEPVNTEFSMVNDMSDELDSGPLDPRIRVRIGRRIADLRRIVGLTGGQLASRVGMSQSKISRIENGRAPVTLIELEALTHALDLPPQEARRILAPASRPSPADRPDDIAEQQSEILRIEAQTRVMRAFNPSAIIGLLQTSEYARAALAILHQVRAADNGRPDPLALLDDRSTVSAALLRSVATRIDRQRVLADSGRRFHFVMKESTLGSGVGTPAQMLAQIQRIREVLVLQTNVTMAIAPLDSYWSLMGPNFVIYDDSHVLLDLPHSSVILTGGAEISIYRRLFDRIEESATTDIEPILDRYLDMYYELARPRRD
jgi:transcriptional regulator with XRE-family HTH domain